MNPDIWKYIAIVAVSSLAGLFTGQFVPNRNVVTSDQLTMQIQPVQRSLDEQNLQIQNLNNRVSALTGELKARNIISKQP